MRKIDRLKKEAYSSCEWRGHLMGSWESSDYYPTRRASCYCKKCGAMACVDSRPDPNGIEIGGSAVAISCIA